jgi:DNA repair exonuclease SbcCD ATPase subunit
LRTALDALQAESDKLLERLGMWRGAAKEAAQNAQQRAQLVKARQALLGKLEDAQDAQDASNEALAQARVAAGVAVAGAKVLSVGGVRSHLLIAALTGLESVANRWLEQIVGSGLSLRLAPYAEKADGGVKDAIAIEIEGAGNGYGYKATSGGERRRIDVALLLAMMEVAGTLYGGDDGTLFFDEVFDALDEDGVEGVCSALESLSEERCVMVITHNKVLESRLKRVASARFNVDAGRVVAP